MLKKWSISTLFLLLVFALTACSGGPNWEVDVTQEPAYLPEKESQMFISVTEDGEPLTGLDITAEFAMVNMDHGTIEATFAETEDGTYATRVGLPMAGEWEVAFMLENDDQEVEKIVEMNVEEAKGVASINGEWITNEDVEFYRFINNLHIEVGRETDREKYTEEKELEEAMKYWDEQQKLNENQNTLVSQIIRLRAMAMLGEEKGHQASADEVQKEVENVRNQYAESEVAQQMIAEFGEEKFWEYQQSQYERIVLTQKVQADVVELVREDSPDASEQEIQFNAQKKYEELLVSQVDSLDIVLL